MIEHLPGQMDIDDFIAKGITRPLTDSEIAEIHPQAVVDKTLAVEDEGPASLSTSARCPICFGPMPCPKHVTVHDEMPPTYDHEPDHGPVKSDAYPYEQPLADNVEILPGLTAHDMPVETVLRQVYEAQLVEVVIVGIDKDGHEVFIRSVADMAPAMWHLQRAVYILNRQYEEMNKGEGS